MSQGRRPAHHWRATSKLMLTRESEKKIKPLLVTSEIQWKMSLLLPVKQLLKSAIHRIGFRSKSKQKNNIHIDRARSIIPFKDVAGTYQRIAMRRHRGAFPSHPHQKTYQIRGEMSLQNSEEGASEPSDYPCMGRWKAAAQRPYHCFQLSMLRKGHLRRRQRTA